MRTIFSRNGSKRRGFSLVELAIVLVILTLLLATLAMPIAGQLRLKRAAETQRLLDLAQQALVGFAAANGRLPCPATDGISIGTTSSFGDEMFASGSSPADGKCAYWAGFLPAVALGLGPLDAEGFMMDAWGIKPNRIRYAVWGSEAFPIGGRFFPFTSTGGVKAATTVELSAISPLATTPRFLFVCQSAPVGALPNASTPMNVNAACGAGVVKLTDKAPAVIYSIGANASTAAGVDEAFNIKTTAIQTFAFVSHAPSNGSNSFDDQVNWISLNVLFSNMQLAGKLP